MSTEPVVPPAVRAAGALTSLQGLGGLALAVALVVRVVQRGEVRRAVLGEAACSRCCSAGVSSRPVVGLLLGKHWGRTPAIVMQLLLLGVAWYVYGPSEQQLWGSLVGIYCVATLVLLFTNPVRRWALGVDEDEPSGRAISARDHRLRLTKPTNGGWSRSHDRVKLCVVEFTTPCTHEVTNSMRFIAP